MMLINRYRFHSVVNVIISYLLVPSIVVFAMCMFSTSFSLINSINSLIHSIIHSLLILIVVSDAMIIIAHGSQTALVSGIIVSLSIFSLSVLSTVFMV